MMPAYYRADRVRKLPPLILHPFSDASSPNKLVLSSRASLMLQGLLPAEDYTMEQLERLILDGRFCEIRMLFYVGKDVLRWIEQCVEVVQREPELRESGIAAQSFAAMLIDDPPPGIREKLSEWGVQDYRAIFARAIGLNSVFAEVPRQPDVTPDFTVNYHYFADQLYTCWRSAREFHRIRSEDFEFDLFASGEYSRLLEQEWSVDEA
jgi:hypothetical protein